jgi:putative ABC transport system permease protein
MLLQDTISLAFTALRRNGLRSVLTTLGVIIGVGSVVTMVSVGSSFQSYLLSQLDGIGTATIDVYPKGLEQFGKQVDTLTFADVDAVAALSTVKDVAPVILIPSSVEANGEKESPIVFATYPEVQKNYGLIIEYGRPLNYDDIRSARMYATVGPDTADELFGRRDVVGEKITIQNRTFTVIGVQEPAGSLIGQDLDKLVTIPFTVGKSMLNQSYVNYMTMQATSDVELTIKDITLLLRQRHQIDNPDNDPDKDDFLVRSTEQATTILTTVTLSITAFLVLVAGISLLVGGIGIMNIMLVSVSERTSEIGLRKAVGATSRDVLQQFLFEAIVLTLTGGFIGIVMGIGLAFIVSLLANYFLGDFPFTVSYLSIIVASLMAIIVGIVFGLLPAKKAASLTPMEAMRSE